MTGHDRSIAVVSDDPNLAAALAAALQSAGLGTVRVSAIGVESRSAALTVLALTPPRLLGAIGRSNADGQLLVLGPDDPELMIESMELGVLGYVMADAAFAEVVRAAEQVLDGHAVVPPPMLGALLRRVVQRRRVERADHERLSALTGRERQVFELAAQGADNGDIAAALYISPATARTHLQRVFKKLDVHSRAEVVAFAARCGLAVERRHGWTG